MAVPRWLKHILAHYGVAYEERRHLPVFSASHLARTEGVSGFRVAKTVFLAAGGRPVAVVLPSCLRLDLGRVEAVLGGGDLRLATKAEIAGWFKGCPPEAV